MPNQGPSLDLDGMDDREIVQLANQVRQSWQPRDEVLRRTTELRKQDWQPLVPPQWIQTAVPQHSSLSTEIPERVTGTLSLAGISYARVPESDAFDRAEAADRVERFHQGAFNYFRRNAVPGKDAWIFTLDQIANKGAACLGSIFAPDIWAGMPIFLNGDEPRMEYWRDSSGKQTDSQSSMDLESTSRAYVKSSDKARRTRPSLPIKRRVVPTDQAYPFFVDGRFLANFIFRKASMVELGAAGFAVELLTQSRGGGTAASSSSYISGTGTGTPVIGRSGEVLEAITANRCRYYLGGDPVKHPKYGTDGIVTNYGFVPYSYRVGLGGGDLEYGSYGLPILSLVESNIRMIDHLLTFQYNAIHLASFTSWYIDHKGDLIAVDREPGGQPTTFDFKTGTIMDFGANVEVKPFLHPGLNKDFDKFLEFQIEEVHRVIPRTLTGVPASSGYNTAQSTIQAKAIFNSIINGAELLLEDVGIMDMHHVNDRVPGPVYLDYERPQDKGSYRKPSLERISLDASDIGDYYQLSVTLDRALDHITEGNFRAQMLEAGIGDKWWAAEGAGISDPASMIKRQARDRVLSSPQIMATLENEAIKQFGMEQQHQEAIAAGRIQQAPDGTPVVKMPNGSVAGPGQGRMQTPAGQGPAGAVLGGANLGSAPGAPNLDATHNPAMQVPGAPGQNRQRRRGGATPGVPQTPHRYAAPEPMMAT